MLTLHHFWFRPWYTRVHSTVNYHKTSDDHDLRRFSSLFMSTLVQKSPRTSVTTNKPINFKNKCQSILYKHNVIIMHDEIRGIQNVMPLLVC